MFDLNPASVILVVAVTLFTAAAAIGDIRTKRIPNKLTLPMFFAGWVFQIGVSIAYGWHHLGSAALGFLVGFGIMFVLWFVGGGGGGDVKLVGALSVWLGFRLTLWMLLACTLFVIAGTTYVVLSTIFTQGMRKTKAKYLATGKTPAGQKPVKETTEAKLGRRVMTFAGPVALATWLVVWWNFPTLHQPLGAAEAPPKKQVVEPAAETSPVAIPAPTGGEE